MGIETIDGDVIGQLRAMQPQHGDVFRVGRGIAVLDPEWAQQVNATNFAGRLMDDRLVDVIRGRSSAPVSWKRLRAAWAVQLTKLSEGPSIAELEGRMRTLADERLERELDLTWAIQEIFTQALIPTVVADLSPRQTETLRRDQSYKLERLMRTEQRHESRREKLRSAILQIRAGLAVRRALRARAKGRRPRQLDLADPLIDMLPELGMDRAAFAVTTILTAIAGPPGAVAVCLLLELVRRPEWTERIRSEISALPPERLHADPIRSAPATHRFVRETLRMWSSPLVLTRVARKTLHIDGETLEPGEIFHLSSYFAHHDSREWDDPETFDPDRWLPTSEGNTKKGPARPCAHAPFGYAPTSCIGAGVGTVELMLLAALFTTRYKIDAIDPESVRILLASVPLPLGFRGTIRRRAG